ncbi:MAG: tetratricopeptide repeat protein [bacterium]
MNKSTIPAWAIILILILVIAFLGVCGVIFYYIYHPNDAALPGKIADDYVTEQTDVIRHSIFLNSIQDPDKDKDGLEDSVAETTIYKTDPDKFDSQQAGVSDANYIYDIYRKAFESGDEHLLDTYRKNFSNYVSQFSQNGHMILGTVSLNDAFNVRSLQTYNFYVGVPTDVVDVVRQALDLRQAGDYENSLKALHDAITKYPDSPVIQYHLGLTYHGLKQYSKALPIYQAIQDNPAVKSPLLYSDIAAAEYSLGAEDQFVKYMNLSIKNFPQDLNQYLKLAAYYQHKNQLDMAESVYNAGLKIEPRYADYYNGLAEIAALQGDAKKELRLYQKAVAYDFRYAPAHENISILYEDVNNDLVGALIEAKIAIDLNPTASHVSHVMEVYTQLGQTAQANKYEAQLLSMKEIDGSSYNSLGLRYLDINDYGMAEKYFKRAIAVQPTLPNPYNNLGIVYISTNHLPEAYTNFQKAIELNPNYANAYSNLGIYYTNSGKYPEAIASFQRAISINPTLYKPYENLGYVYKVMGNSATNKALEIASYKKAIELGAPDATVRESLRAAMQ